MIWEVWMFVSLPYKKLKRGLKGGVFLLLGLNLQNYFWQLQMWMFFFIIIICSGGWLVWLCFCLWLFNPYLTHTLCLYCLDYLYLLYIRIYIVNTVYTYCWIKIIILILPYLASQQAQICLLECTYHYWESNPELPPSVTTASNVELLIQSNPLHSIVIHYIRDIPYVSNKKTHLIF